MTDYRVAGYALDEARQSSSIPAGLFAAMAPKSFNLARAISPNLRSTFEAGQFSNLLMTGTELTTGAAMAWARGYNKHWQLLERLAGTPDPYYGMAGTPTRQPEAELAELLTMAAKATGLTPAGLMTGVGKGYEATLVTVSQRPDEKYTRFQALAAIDAYVLSANRIPARVTAKELRAAVPYIQRNKDHSFIQSLSYCNRGFRPVHCALQTHINFGMTQSVQYLDICGGDIELAIAYAAVGVEDLDILLRLVRSEVPPEYAALS